MKADEREARRIVEVRAGGDPDIRFKGYCEAQAPGCYGRATEYQHRKAKAHCTPAERWDPRNGLMVCGFGNTDGCHGYIHQNPIVAGEKGWTVKSNKDPALIPVQYRDYPERMFLLADGGMTDASWEALMLAGYGYPAGGDAA